MGWGGGGGSGNSVSINLPGVEKTKLSDIHAM